MATFSLPNITLGISVWYIQPLANAPPNQLKPYTALTLVQLVVPTPTFDLVPQQPKQDPTPIGKESSKGAKA